MGGLESSGSSQDVVTSNGDVQRTQARVEELFGDCDGTESVDAELFGDCGSQ